MRSGEFPHRKVIIFLLLFLTGCAGSSIHLPPISFEPGVGKMLVNFYGIGDEFTEHQRTALFNMSTRFIEENAIPEDEIWVFQATAYSDEKYLELFGFGCAGSAVLKGPYGRVIFFMMSVKSDRCVDTYQAYPQWVDQILDYDSYFAKILAREFTCHIYPDNGISIVPEEQDDSCWLAKRQDPARLLKLRLNQSNREDQR